MNIMWVSVLFSILAIMISLYNLGIIGWIKREAFTHRVRKMTCGLDEKREAELALLIEKYNMPAGILECLSTITDKYILLNNFYGHLSNTHVYNVYTHNSRDGFVKKLGHLELDAGMFPLVFHDSDLINSICDSLLKGRDIGTLNSVDLNKEMARKIITKHFTFKRSVFVC